ncbi:hypothetical protein WMY93_018337 [Mugilogobius chulae]|uniref:EMI domain-containing protein n=1 Tax=Mugilogobius chulae TaxID=88201 RepID=A0AAW0NLB3_9GOBI
MRQVLLLLLLLGLLLRVQGELRARDPEVEQEDPEATEGHRRSSLSKDNVPLGGEPQGTVPTRSGNWCAVVQKQVVPAEVASGTEPYTIKSHSPCPSGIPNCHLVMYKLSTRPLYRQIQRVVTALLWQCCAGYTGPNCEHSVSGSRLNPDSSGLSEEAVSGPGADSAQQDHAQKTQPRLLPGTAHYSEHTYRAPGQQEQNVHTPSDRNNPVTFRYQDTSAVLPVPHMMALVMSQLQPVLEAFNVAELKGLAPSELEADSLNTDGLEDEDRLEQVYQELRETQDQMQQQHHSGPEQPSSELTPGSEVTALWRAVERLDNGVINNTMKVQTLLEDVEVASGSIQQLHRLYKEQDKRINPPRAGARDSQGQQAGAGGDGGAGAIVGGQRLADVSGGSATRLQQVTSSWALEQNRSREMERSLADLSWSLQQWQAEVTHLQQTEAQRSQENQNLRGSFNSLLKDGIRHSDVLELLLGEEVLESKGRPSCRSAVLPHSSFNGLAHWGRQWRQREEGPARERQSLFGPQLRDGSDLWKLEQAVEKLQHRVDGVEEKQNSSSRLQDEVKWLKRGLEDHLRVFKNIFSNTDKLSRQPLELDKVLELVKSRQRRKGGSGNGH